MLGDERLELADELAVATELEVAVDPLRQRLEAKLVQPLRLVRREGLERQVAERRVRARARAPPDISPPLRRRSSCSSRSRLACATSDSNRSASTSLAPARKTYPGACVRTSVAARVTERFAQARDVDLNGFRRSRRRRLSPELVDQSLRRHNFAAVEEQDTENGALLRVTELDNLALAEHLERSEDVELHQPVLPLSKPVS